MAATTRMPASKCHCCAFAVCCRGWRSRAFLLKLRCRSGRARALELSIPRTSSCPPHRCACIFWIVFWQLPNALLTSLVGPEVAAKAAAAQATVEFCCRAYFVGHNRYGRSVGRSLARTIQRVSLFQIKQL